MRVLSDRTPGPGPRAEAGSGRGKGKLADLKKQMATFLRRRGVGDPSSPDVYEEDKAITDREQREMALAMAAGEQMRHFVNPYFSEIGLHGELGSDKERERLRLKESHPETKKYIEDTLFGDVGLNEVYDEDLGAVRPVDATKEAWSAATTSNLMKAFDPDFQGSARHSDFIRRALKGEQGDYYAEELGRKTDYKPGDVLFQGRRDKKGTALGPQTYDEFELDAGGGGQWGQRSGYGSHTDVIVGTGTEPILNRKGEQKKDLRGRPRTRTYYDVQGGNASDTLRLKRYYANDMRDNYLGRITS